jgi:putative molybdopterin biosynthesis protein
VHRVQLHYTLTRDAGEALVRHPLIDLLQAVDAGLDLGGSARAGVVLPPRVGRTQALGDELGNELIVWEKGQSARLSEFGAKLMWAERQAQARLSPQIDALRADLERAFAVAFDPSAHVLTLYASHDDALPALRAHAGTGWATLHLDIRFTGSVDAIRALNEGRCVLAGFHTLQHTTGKTLTERTYKPAAATGPAQDHRLCAAHPGPDGGARQPAGPARLADLATRRARFANRALGSGTRVVLDELLARPGSASDIAGYAHTEPSHAAVAQAVAAGQFDAGLGIAAAAQGAGLDFVPLADERYHLVCLKSALAQPGVAALLQLLQTPAWQAELAGIAGYAALQSGEVLSMRKVLPWWDYRRDKPHATATTAVDRLSR